MISTMTRDEYDRVKAEAERRGYKVVTRYRKGLKSVKLGDMRTKREHCRACPSCGRNTRQATGFSVVKWYHESTGAVRCSD